jgi:hypothetical protein
MDIGHNMKSWALLAGASATLWGAAGVAQARDVVWSVGVGGPGVQVGVTNAPPPVVVHRPVHLHAAPVYWQQPVVISQPQTIYYAHPRTVYYGGPQVIMAPQPVYRGWGPHRRGHRDRWNHDRRDFEGGRDDRGHH